MLFFIWPYNAHLDELSLETAAGLPTQVVNGKGCYRQYREMAGAWSLSGGVAYD
jgi:hypothetical protein